MRVVAAVALMLVAGVIWAGEDARKSRPSAKTRPAKELLMTNPAGKLINPEVWMCHHGVGRLLAEDADWAFVKKHITGIKLYIGGVYKGRPARLKAFGKMAQAEGIQVSIECGGTLGRGRFDDTIGARSARQELKAFNKFTDAGGVLNFIDMDGPVRRLLYPKGKEGFKSIDRCTDQLMIYMRSVRKAQPKLKFFLLTNFPNWGYRGDVSYHARGPKRQDWGDYHAVVTNVVAKAKAAKLPLVGLTVDNPYEYLIGEYKSAKLTDPTKVNWIKRVRALEDYAKSEGLQFNLIVNSEAGGKKSAKEFYERTLKMVDAYQAAGGKPTRYIVQSWYPNPRKIQPETAPHTMTALVKAVMLKVHPELKDLTAATPKSK